MSLQSKGCMSRNGFDFDYTDRLNLGGSRRGVMPYIYADVLHVALLLTFPVLVTFLPSLMS